MTDEVRFPDIKTEDEAARFLGRVVAKGKALLLVGHIRDAHELADIVAAVAAPASLAHSATVPHEDFHEVWWIYHALMRRRDKLQKQFDAVKREIRQYRSPRP